MNSGLPYGGDEIGGLVFDIGSHSFRAGYAQDECPKFDIPAVVGVDDMVENQNENNSITTKRKYCIDIPVLYAPRKGVEVRTYMKDGMIDNWDLFEQTLDFIYERCFLTESKYHPILISESSSNSGRKREQLTELMFEKYNAPALFLAKNAALVAFANSRVSGLVIDSGATHTSAVAIHDGYVLSNAIVKSPLAGDFITIQCKQYLLNNNIDIIPPYMIAGKECVKSNEPANWTKKNKVSEVSSSWHDYMVKQVVQNFQHEALQISEMPFDDKINSALSTLHYEFPNGYNLDLGSDRFRIPELLFDPPSDLGGSMLGVSNLVMTSITACDVDVRPLLFNNIMLTGGNTCIQGFDNRLNRDLSLRVPSNTKLRGVPIPPKSRRFNAWVGGSILSSLASSKSMYISSQEYQENGKGHIHGRCL